MSDNPFPSYPGANDPGYSPYTEPTTQGPRLASWGRRVGATIIDVIIIGVIAFIVGAITGSRGVYYGFDVILALFYTTILIGGPGGRTVGMMAVKTRCVDANTGGSIGYGRGFIRWLLSEIMNATVVIGLLDILWPLWDHRNQTLHDKVANSLVIEV